MRLCGGHSDLLLLLLLLTAAFPPGGWSEFGWRDKKVRNVECETTGYEIIGDDFLVLCPGQCLRQQPLIWGSGVYASISSVCGAAIHSGVFSNSNGGMVRVSKKAGMRGYVSKFANGLRSISLPKWSRSFVFPEAARSMAQSSQQWEQESLVSIDDKVDGRRLSFEAYRKGFLSSEAEAKPAAKDISSPKGPNPFQQYIGRNLVTTSRKPTTTTVPPKKMNKDCNVDIAFLIEGSWSLGVRRFESQKRFVTKVVEELQKTTDGAAVGLIQFGHETKTEIGLNKFPTLQGVISAMRKVSPIGGTSNAGRAIDEVVQSFFQASAGNRREAPNAAVLLLDGWPSDDLEVPARAARETGINIFIVMVEGATSEELASGVHGDFVNKSVCRPDGHFSLHTDRWTASSALVSPLVSRVCNTERLICSKTCLNSADLVFLVDGSSSVGHENFPALLEFVANVTGHFEVARAGTHVGIVQYTYEQRTEVELGRHTTPEGVREAVHRVHYWSGGTSTGAAITYTRQEMFAHSHSGKRRLLVLITDGRSYDDVREPAAAARKEGIILYAVGIAWAMKDELDAVANDPKSEHVFFVSDFDDLP